MLNRLGFAGRLLSIILLVVLAAIAIGTGAGHLSQSEQLATAPRLPLPEQAAAIVALLDDTPESDRLRLLKAVDSVAMAVSISRERPTFGDANRRLKAVEWMVAQYIEAAQGREVIAAVEHEPGTSWLASFVETYSPLSRQPLRLAISLKSGEFAVFEARGGVGIRMLGLPAGFWIGAIGALTGIAAILAVMREARPLRLLSESVSRFAHVAEPQPVKPEGAPEIKVLIAAVNDMQTRIAKLVAGRTILLGAVSHDLRTFLTRLRLRVESIPDTEQQSKAIRDLDDMVHLIDGALAVARGNTVVERKELLDLAEIVAADVSDRPADKCTFKPSTSNDMCSVLGDSVGLRRLVANLIDNALRFGTRCCVEIARRDGEVHLTVDDNGPGIADADKDMIFEPFYRADTSRSRATGGSGLGLAISKQIVDTHGGTILYQRSPMGGARFLVTLKTSSNASDV
jgi:two-component system, OmpR family, osmolarity sensor histidine kinase EnvZ